MKFSLLFVLSICLVVIVTGTATPAAAARILNVYIDGEKELTLDFQGSRIRVETWAKDYVQIEPTYLVKESYELDVQGNLISFDREQHLQKYPDDLKGFIPNEVFFMIKIPGDIGVNIYAESANIKERCLLKSVIARYVNVRESVFLNGFTGKGQKIHIRDSHFRGEKVLDYECVSIDNRRGFWKTILSLLF